MTTEVLRQAAGAMKQTQESLVFLSQKMPAFNALVAKVRDFQEKIQEKQQKIAKIEGQERKENGRLGEKHNELQGVNTEIFNKNQTVIQNNEKIKGFDGTIKENKAKIEKLKKEKQLDKASVMMGKNMLVSGQKGGSENTEKKIADLKQENRELGVKKQSLEKQNQVLKVAIQDLTSKAKILSEEEIPAIEKSIAQLGDDKGKSQNEKSELISQKNRTETEASRLQAQIQAEQASNERFVTRAHEFLAQASKQIEARPENDYYEKEADAGVWPN